MTAVEHTIRDKARALGLDGADVRSIQEVQEDLKWDDRLTLGDALADAATRGDEAKWSAVLRKLAPRPRNVPTHYRKG